MTIRPFARFFLSVALLAPHAWTQTSPGDVLTHLEVSTGMGGFGGTLGADDWFGSALAFIGDLDGNGVEELAVGAPGDDDGGTNKGAVWILFRDSNGSLMGEVKISATNGNLTVPLGAEALFGSAIVGLGDRDHDGLLEIAVGAPRNGAGNDGSVFLLELNEDGKVDSNSLIATDSREFGYSLAGLQDIDGDGNTDLAVGAPNGTLGGVVHILLLDASGGVMDDSVFGRNQGGFGDLFNPNAFFGSSLLSHDVTGDGWPELVVGARFEVGNAGKIWICSLTSTGSVSSEVAIGGGVLGLGLLPGDNFGAALAAVSDVNGDGIADLAVGAPGADQVPGDDHGALWILRIDQSGQLVGTSEINNLLGNFGSVLLNGDEFGSALVSQPASEEGPCPALIVGAPFTSGLGVPDRGAFHVLQLKGPSSTDVGLGHTGSNGQVPQLTIDGVLFGGTLVDIVLTGARPNAPAWLIVGLERIDFFPFLGGTLVPFPDLIEPAATNAQGMGGFTAFWPFAIPPCTELYFQFWIEDPAAAPFGFAASNGVLAVASGD